MTTFPPKPSYFTDGVLAYPGIGGDSFPRGPLPRGPHIRPPLPPPPSVTYSRVIRRLTARVKKLESVIEKNAPKGDAIVKGEGENDAGVDIKNTRVTDSDSSTNSDSSDSSDSDDEENRKETEKDEKPVPQPDQTNEWGSTVHEVKFFHAEGESERRGKWANTSRRKGSYQCRIDPKHLIRVLYNWADGGGGAHVHGDTAPDPDDVEILAFGVMSKSVADFFRTKLRLDCGSTNLVRLSKPFRPLIRNMSALREELARLEAKASCPLSNSSHSEDKMDVEEASISTRVKAEDAISDGSSSPVLVPSTPDVPENENGNKNEKVEVAADDSAVTVPEVEDSARHFRMLIEFAERYLAKQLKLFDKIQRTEEDKISFENLWMLFDAGMDVYAPTVLGGRRYGSNDAPHVTKTRRLPQLFRIQACGGGLPLRSTPSQEQEIRDDDFIDKAFAAAGLVRGGGSSGSRGGCVVDDDDDDGDSDESRRGQERDQTMPVTVAPSDRIVDDASPSSSSSSSSSSASSLARNGRYTHMHVICFNIDYNGTRYGIVHECFSFKPYDGLRDIRELQVYPVGYMDSAPGPSPPAQDGEVGDYFLARGRKFMGLTSATHMSYEGLTVGDSPEEINSAVVVDINMAFQEYRRQLPDQETAVPIFRGLTYHWIQRMINEPFEFCQTRCEDAWCCKPLCVADTYHGSLRTRLQRKGIEISTQLEELASECARQGEKGGMQNLSSYMEKGNLVRLLPGVVPAFALRSRRWVMLDLDRLRDVPRGLEWKNLVLPKGHKKMVQAMVETHTMGTHATGSAQGGPNDKMQVDLVQGKGRGCIILLHGVPGVGKTSTAECVAAYTGRPLYQITCGDIGYLPEDVEEAMQQHFKLAHAWGCVLLLDEADVFLARRSKADVKRNGLVSVFLRILEYYSGILFLTTNRVGAIDDAFRSRLHMMLYYPQLSKKHTAKIWQNNLRRIKTFNLERKAHGRLPIRFDEAKILAWAKANYDILQWNGRQIRNAVQTAIALSEFRAKVASKRGGDHGAIEESPVITKSDFHEVASASIKFNEYMDETVGFSEDGYAAREKMRPRHFTPKVKLKNLESDEEDTSDSCDSGSDEAGGEDTPVGGSDSSDSSDDEDDESDSDKERMQGQKKKKKTTIVEKAAKTPKPKQKKGKKEAALK